MPPADFGLGRRRRRRRVLALLQLHLIEPRLQHRPGRGPVLMLRALVLALHHDVGREVRDAHGAVGGVHMLAAAPLERYVSIRQSPSFTAMSMVSSTTG